MMVVTSNDIPGWDIHQVCGEVFGLTVRSRNAFSQIGAGFKSIVGGELNHLMVRRTVSRSDASVAHLEIHLSPIHGADGHLRFVFAQVIDGMTAACAEAGCALLGGETAEHPNAFPVGEYDLAGFAVGVVEKSKAVDGTRIASDKKAPYTASWSAVGARPVSLVRRSWASRTISARSWAPRGTWTAQPESLK